MPPPHQLTFPVPRSFSFHSATGNQTSTPISESACGLIVTVTRQYAGRSNDDASSSTPARSGREAAGTIAAPVTLAFGSSKDSSPVQ